MGAAVTQKSRVRYDVSLALIVPTNSYLADCQSLEDEITSWLEDLNIRVEGFTIKARETRMEKRR